MKPANYCENCGARIDSKKKFCSACGCQVNAAIPTNQMNNLKHSKSVKQPNANSYMRQRVAWAVIFGLLLIPMVLFLIWRDVGEFASDVWLSLAGFILVTTVLAVFTLRNAGSTWQAEFIQVIQQSKGMQLDFKTDQGKIKTVYGDDRLAEYFSIGDRVIKIKGFDFPEKIQRDGEQQLCVACGRVYPIVEKRCRYCRFPSIDPQDYI